MAEELSLEKQKALARARARAKVAGEGPAEWSDVVTQAPLKAAASFGDQIINTPENLYNIFKMIYGTGQTLAGNPSEAPNVEAPNNFLTSAAEEAGYIDTNMQMTPAQRIVDAGIQGATLGAVAPAAGLKQLATNAAISGGSSAAGRATAEATGSEGLGLAVSIAAPFAASRFSVLSAERGQQAAMNAVRDKTFADARSLGFVVVPEGKAADFAGRKKMLQTAVAVNQAKTTESAKRVLGLPREVALDGTVLNRYRSNAYNQGYLPLKSVGRFTTDMDYLNDLIAVEQKYTGQAGSFPQHLPKTLRKLIDSNTVNNVDAGDVVDRIKTLRFHAGKNVNADDPVKVELGYAQKEIANAMEDLLERQATNAGLDPSIISNYKQARKNIAVSHTVEDSMIKGSGDIDPDKLARAYQRGEYMDGELETVARFANINKPVIEGTGQSSTPYSYLGGLALSSMAAKHMGIEDPNAVIAIAAGGAAAGRAAHEGLSKPIRKYLMSKAGQARSAPNYEDLGVSSKLTAPAVLGAFSSMQNREE